MAENTVEPFESIELADLFPCVEVASTTDGEHYSVEWFSSRQYAEAREAIRRFQADTEGNEKARMNAYFVVKINAEDFCKGTTVHDLIYSDEPLGSHPLCK